VCGNPSYRRPFEPLLDHVVFLPFDDSAALGQIDESVAAVIVEPIQGEGGVRVPGDDFLRQLRRRCGSSGGLLVFDEVMTGFARTGRWFACQHWDVCPDVLVLAKALGGGMPLGGFVSRPEIMATLSRNPPLSHVTTFGGHPLSCAAGLAALDYAESRQLCGRATHLGAVWQRRLGELKGRALCDVRGRGMLLGLEFASPELTRAFCRAALARNLILNWTLHSDSVVRLAPPLIMSDEESEHALAAIADAIGVAAQ
jgi:acetylornithine/succinyldiaminopimelate/putrescine aminotransferase